MRLYFLSCGGIVSLILLIISLLVVTNVMSSAYLGATFTLNDEIKLSTINHVSFFVFLENFNFYIEYMLMK